MQRVLLEFNALGNMAIAIGLKSKEKIKTR